MFCDINKVRLRWRGCLSIKCNKYIKLQVIKNDQIVKGYGNFGILKF